MKISPWQRRIQRAEQLAREYPFAAEILGFYEEIASFQENFYHRLETIATGSGVRPSSAHRGPPELAEFTDRFGCFLSLVEKKGPRKLAVLAHDLKQSSHESWSELLDAGWNASTSSTSVAEEFLTQAFLQPYAEFIRSRLALPSDGYTKSRCPFCNRKPGLGVLRQQGDGARRSLMCSFCLSEWEFRRIVCAGCGEENHTKLPVYAAADFAHLRVECCDTCHVYIKTVDLTKNGLAEPIVDEIATAPLDLWAEEHGYAKLHRNLMGM
jgi:FdhE protein